MTKYWFVLYVNPTPWTAPTVSIGRKNGKPFPMVYSAEELKNYKAAIKDEAEREIREKYPDFAMIEDEVSLHFWFYRSVDELHRGKGRSRRANYADATNLQKATEDGLQGVLFADDKQVVDVRSTIAEQSQHVGTPCVIVKLVWHPTKPKAPDQITESLAVDREKQLEAQVAANEHELPEDIF